MSTGSLTQLAALGSQDQYLSVAGEITFFKGVYRRHTNFAKESVYMQFNQNPNWGSQTTCVISRTGDLLSKMWLYVKLPQLNKPLEKDEFMLLKKNLMGNIELYDESGIPCTKAGNAPWNPKWTKKQNESDIMPVLNTDTNKFIDGTVENSLPKNLFIDFSQDPQLALTNAGYAAAPAGTTDALWLQTHYITGGAWNSGTAVWRAEVTAEHVLARQDGHAADAVTGAVGAITFKKFEWKKGLLDEATFDSMPSLMKEFITQNPGKNPKARYCDEVGHALIDKVDLVIGGTLIDSHPGHYLQIWNELTQTPEKKQIGHLIGRSGSEAELEDLAMTEQELYIPLQFFFCRHLMCSLPLIALQYHQVEVKVTFAALDKVVAFGGYEYNSKPGLLNQAKGHQASWYQQYLATQESSSGYVSLRDKSKLNKQELAIREARLMCNLVYLEEEERKTFAGSTHEYLVDLLQYQGPMSCGKEQTTYHAYFNHPTSELIWTFVPKISIQEGEPFNYTALQSSYNQAGDPMLTAKLQFNGYDRFTAMPAEYFREIIPAQYHTSVPTRPVYVYSFALEPEDFRPSGSVNLSRIDNVKLITTHVNFEPKIAMQNFVAYDSKMPYGGQGDVDAVKVGSSTIAKQRLLNQATRLNTANAVAVHPNLDGNGLFLQTTDGFASQIVAGAELRVYARSKNVLRIKSGMAGLAYAN